MAKKVNIIVAGSRSFDDYELLKEKCDYYLSDALAKGYDIEIVSGTAKGADKLGEQYAKERGYHIAYFHPDWKAYGKRAGYLRNQQMANFSDALICFWDGSSKGTKHMIDIARGKHIPVRTVIYDKK